MEKLEVDIRLPYVVGLWKHFFKAQLAGVSVFRRLSKPVGTFTLPFILWLVLAFINTHYPLRTTILRTESSSPLLPPVQKSLPQQKQRICFPKKLSFKVHLCPKIRSVVTRQKGVYFFYHFQKCIQMLNDMSKSCEFA